MIRNFFALFILCCLFLIPVKGFSQETESTTEDSPPAGDSSEEIKTTEDILPPKRNLFADIGYSFLGITTANFFLNFVCRLADAPFANITFSDIGENFTEPGIWEDGDRFHVNQLGHAYLGAIYFASARVNGFNYYQSIPAALFGAVMWEMIFEPELSYNDVITTTVSGLAFGEMMYRLFLEVDSKKSFGAKIGGFFISPSSSQSKIYNRVHEPGGGNIYDLSLKVGVEKSFAFFPEQRNNENSWKYPGGHIEADVVYGNPFLQQSKKPYDHFNLYAGFTTNANSYHAAIISDGYLFSINTANTDRSSASTGLGMHFDVYNATNDFMNNEGKGNINFSSSAIGWTFKHKYLFSEKSHLEIKTHINALLWGNSTYNDTGVNLWGNNYFLSNCTFGIGENVKLSLSLVHKKMGRLDLNAYGYHIFAIPVTETHSKGNVFFLYSSINYDFPITSKVGIGVKETFWQLFGMYDLTGNVNRRLASSCLYTWFKF